MAGLGGCSDQIERLNPADPPIGAHGYPTPLPRPVPNLKPASQPEVRLEPPDDYTTTGDHLVIHNRSDGALYDLEVIVNNDYLYTMPVLPMGEAVRVPDSYLHTAQGKPFPTDRQVRIVRIEVHYQGRVLAVFDRRPQMRPGTPR
jgi:hypothetical protein